MGHTVYNRFMANASVIEIFADNENAPSSYDDADEN